MQQNTDDLRIVGMKALLPPAILIEEIPVEDAVSDLVSNARHQLSDILHGRDKRLAVMVGPCSIHDSKAAIEYAQRLRELALRYQKDLLIVMRVYFEKPRTVVGWKGLVNDPEIDGSFRINDGLRTARRLLRDISQLGLPTGTEFLDTITPQFFADFVAWGAIGARTTESQVHRELASGLSMPVGFKNATNGNVQVAIDAVRAARAAHWFPSVTKQGVTAIFHTAGNPDGHVILRGGSAGVNYDAEHVRAAAAALAKVGLAPHVVVDCSHGNSRKDYKKQLEAGADIARQIAGGEAAIAGVMIESNLVEGRQDYDRAHCVYGQSITDACIGFDDTVALLDTLAKAVSARKRG